MTERFWGVDFSGGAAPWRSTVSKPSVWLAEAIQDRDALSLTTLQPVQDLPGADSPFERLVALLERGEFAAAAVDAPFSIPALYLPQQSHAALLERVRWLANGKNKPFPEGTDLVGIAQLVHLLASKKPLRNCEQYWVSKGVNTRSTLWNGPRGGAPFAAACLTLIARSNRPCWPWHTGGRGLLVEAFPAAQLKQWGWPHQRYNGPKGADTRVELVERLTRRIGLSPRDQKTMLASADALDAVLAIFAAVAACKKGIVPDHGEEGWISVDTSEVAPRSL